MPANVIGSFGPTWNRSPRSNRVAGIAATSPSPRPSPTRAQVLPDDHADDLALSRAERHADAEFPRALRDRIRDDAVDAERGEQQCRARENAHRHGRQPRPRDRFREYFIERPHGRHRQQRVDLIDHADRGRVRAAPDRPSSSPRTSSCRRRTAVTTGTRSDESRRPASSTSRHRRRRRSRAACRCRD